MKNDKEYIDFRESYSLGYFIPTRNLFGLPERADKFKLRTSNGEDPYRLQSLDVFPHSTFTK